MLLDGQCVVPAVNNMRSFEKLLQQPFRNLIILDSHLSQIGTMVKMGKEKGKKIFLHADLIQGLKSDLPAAEFICQNLRPYGLISTRSSVLDVAKKRGLKTVQRIFLLDSRSLETGYRLLEQVQPDMVEILPGVIPEMIRQVVNDVRVPVIAGGLIHSEHGVCAALEAGATAISTSNTSLWTFDAK
ncbi:glycerol-3-phosphate responsive antiterminator [Sporolactobacillus spathodeae]